MKKITLLLLCAVMILAAAAGCKQGAPADKKGEKKELKIAGTPEIIELLEQPLKDKGYKVELVTFNGLQDDAMALKDHAVDCVLKNNNRWAATFSEKNDTDIITMKPYLWHPLRAMYSEKWNSIEEIPENGKIVIATDSANQQRDLKTLESTGLIKLGEKPSMGAFFTIYDIVENPKNLEIIPVDHTTAVTYLGDVDAVICGSRFMKEAGKDPKKYLVSDPNSEKFAHGLMIHETDKDAQWVKDIMEVFKTKAFQDGFNKAFDGTYILMPQE